MTREDLKKIASQIAKDKQAKKQGRPIQEIIEEAKKIDKSKKRKAPTKEEKAQQELEAMLNYKESPKEDVEIKPKKDDEWDVKIGDPIEYFDPELSYELTGYRPITATKGLDFDPKLFTVAADQYRKYGRYTQLLPGTFAHRNHWVEEFNRCKDGVTIGKYTLTGENYFFLNYYRLLSVLGNGEGGEIRQEDFPGFFAKQYEYFHYINLARKLGKDGLAFKARGVGFSEIAASNLACAYTFHKASYNIVTAFDEKYVTQTLSKVWQELDFLNTCTEDAFRRLRMKVDTGMKKRASKVDQDKNESGWMSTIEGITADSPRKLRGNRVYSLYFEEAGSNPQLIDTYIQSRALVEILGYRVGSRFVFGTGGDSGPNLEGLAKMFNNPEEYSILPYKNFYSKSGDVSYSGFFIPAHTLWFGTKDNPGYDSRGVVDETRARSYYEEQWKRIKDSKLLIKDKAEYCLTPEDAFALEGGGVFDSEKLAEQKMNIEQLKIVQKPQRARLVWPYNKDIQGVDRDQIPVIKFESTGNVQIVETPMTDVSGQVINNLYVIGVDGIDTGKDTSTGQKDVSKYAIVVLRRRIGLKPPKIVAIYKERPNNPEEAHDMALKLAQFYNAKVLFEATRVSIFAHFKRWNKLYYFLRRPKVTVSSRHQNINQYGCPATDNIIQHQIELIQQYIYDCSDQIDFIEVIDELIRYSDAAKRKFDLVAALGMALLADEDMIGKTPREQQSTDKKIKNIGYYINEYGQKTYGIINQEVSGPSSTQFGWFRENPQRYN